MTFRYAMTQEDLAVYNTFTMLNSGLQDSQKKRTLIVVGLLVVYAAIMALSKEWVIVITLVLCAALFGFIIIRNYSEQGTMTRMKKQVLFLSSRGHWNGIFDERIVIVDEENISTSTDGVHSVYKYSEINSIKYYKGIVILGLRQGNALIIPDRAFENEQQKTDMINFTRLKAGVQ